LILAFLLYDCRLVGECEMNVRLRVTLLVPLLVILPTACRAQDGDKAAVIAVVQRLFDALEARDSVAGMATFHPSATILVVAGTPATVTQTTPAALVGSIARSTAGTFKERIFDTEVRIDGDVAQLWAYFTVHIGKVFNRCGIDAMTFVRVEGAWKISHASFTRRTQGCRHTEPLP
jgi:ketosteroid isomerase-like protein